MNTEVPMFKRCCLCVPLRYGLLAWSYFLLIPVTYILLCYIGVFIFMINHGGYSNQAIVATIISFLLFLVTYGLTFLLIVAAHKKSRKLMNIYFIWGMRTAIVHFVVGMSDLIYDFIAYWEYISLNYVIFGLLSYIFYFGLQMYFVLLVRSEIIKLESNLRFQFSNIAAEAERSYYEANTKEKNMPDTIDIEGRRVAAEVNKLTERAKIDI